MPRICATGRRSPTPSTWPLAIFTTASSTLWTRLSRLVRGAFGLLGDIELEDEPIPNIAEHIKLEARWIEQNADAITGGIRSLQNLLDGLTDLYLTTYYKLKNLS